MKKNNIVLGLLFMMTIFGCATEGTPAYQPLGEYEKGEELLIGKFSTTYINNDAFGILIPGLDIIQRGDFIAGDRLFLSTWVPAPASTTGLDGLGPTFNANSCSGCHFKDGRGMPLDDSTLKDSGFLMRLSIGNDPITGPIPVPNYGGQLQDNGVLRIPGEGNVRVTYELVSGIYPDGTTYELRKPTYSFFDEQFGALNGVMTSPRIGQQTIGLGFVDALSASEILKNADEFDADNDGISGKANYVWNIRKQKATIGKFGWKANAPTLEQQVAGAFHGDMGLTTSLFPNQNCPSIQQDCADAPTGDQGDFEVPDEKLREIVFYQTTLAVPVRRNVKDEDVLAGKELFKSLNCVTCHVNNFYVEHSELVPMIDGTTIKPYSDFLLHDMGEDLADNRPDFLADGKEWRTQPLWGIGLIETVNRHTFLLHDGRARNIEEAILWHGGEAEKSKQDFMNLSEKEREQVIKFVNSL